MNIKDYTKTKLQEALPQFSISVERDASVRGWQFFLEAKKDPLSLLMIHDDTSIELLDFHFPQIIILLKKVTGKLYPPLRLYLGFKPSSVELYTHRGLENPFWYFSPPFI